VKVTVSFFPDESLSLKKQNSDWFMHGDPIEGRHEEADICVKPSLLSCYLVLTLQATAINSNLKAVNAHWFV
jgi:hypothetical protein